MMNLIDTHCHLNDPAFSGDIVKACSEVQDSRSNFVYRPDL